MYKVDFIHKVEFICLIKTSFCLVCLLHTQIFAVWAGICPSLFHGVQLGPCLPTLPLDPCELSPCEGCDSDPQTVRTPSGKGRPVPVLPDRKTGPSCIS